MKTGAEVGCLSGSLPSLLFGRSAGTRAYRAETRLGARGRSTPALFPPAAIRRSFLPTPWRRDESRRGRHECLRHIS